MKTVVLVIAEKIFRDEEYQAPKDILSKAGGKVYVSICIAPVILANAGLLKGKRATVFPSGLESLNRGGAVYTGGDVEGEGKMIKRCGPTAADAVGERVLGFA